MPEIRIEAIVYAEELRELIRTMVRAAGKAGDGTGTGALPVSPGRSADWGEMLEELRKIRSLLEKGR
jgi:hypothetical protein